MQWFYNFKISAKLISSFIIVALMTGVIGVIGIINIQNMDTLDTELYKQHTVQISELGQIVESYQLTRIRFRDMIIKKDSNSRSEVMTKLKADEKVITDNLNKLEQGIKEEAVQKEFDNLYDLLTIQFPAYRDKVLSLVTLNHEEEAFNYMFSEGTDLNNDIVKSLDALVDLKVLLAKNASETNTAIAHNTVTTMITIVSIAVLLAIGLGLFISLIISQPINKMVEAADKLAVGDVNVVVEADSKDEIGSLAQSFGRMIANIRGQAMAAERIAAGDLTVEVAIKS